MVSLPCASSEKLQKQQFKIGSKANESCCLYNSGPMVRHYALMYGFHTLQNLLKSWRPFNRFGSVWEL